MSSDSAATCASARRPSRKFEAVPASKRRADLGDRARRPSATGPLCLARPSSVSHVRLRPSNLQYFRSKPRDDAQALRVVIEAAEASHRLIERALAGMAERRMAEVVGERDRLGEILVEAQLRAPRCARSAPPRASASAACGSDRLRERGTPASCRSAGGRPSHEGCGRGRAERGCGSCTPFRHAGARGSALRPRHRAPGYTLARERGRAPKSPAGGHSCWLLAFKWQSAPAAASAGL